MIHNCKAMKWLAEDVVYLSCAQEISKDLVYYKAKESQFSIAKPYQAREIPVSEASGPTASGSQDHSEGRQEEDVPAPSSDKSLPAGTKRKRSGITRDVTRAARESEAQQRHLKVHEQLLRAHNMYLAFQAQQEALKATSREVASTRAPEGSVPSEAAHQKLDIIALSHMKRAIEPGLTIEADENLIETFDLFDELNCNSGDEELYGDAAGHALVLPPRSRFLIADITCLEPLLSGQHILVTCSCPELCLPCIQHLPAVSAQCLHGRR